MPTDSPSNSRAGTTISWLITVCVTVGAFLALLNNFVPLVFVATELVTSCVLFVALRRLLYGMSDRLAGYQLSIATVSLVALPFVLERVSRAIFLFGLPLEATTICAVRNLSYLPMLFPRNRRCQSAGVAVSLLSMLSIYLQDHSTSTSIVVFSYCVLGICWLIAWHWSKLQLKVPAHAQRQIPFKATLGIVGLTLACALIALLTLPVSSTTMAIAGFMPSSGGNRWSDPYAFGGVGDGDQMVGATDSAKSIGPIESELFLESKMPSIYDVFNDLYQEPTGRPKKTSRAIPLSPNDSKPNHDRLAKNEAASREFSATRRKSGRDVVRDLADVRSDAIFYVQGRVPLHLRHEVYNTWDGITLSFQGSAHGRDLTLVTLDQEPWLRCGVLPDTRFHGDIETHVIRIARLSTHRVPSPADLCALHLDKLHTAKFFRWTNDGVLCFAENNIPQMTVFHTRSVPPRREAVESIHLIRDQPDHESELHPDVLRNLRIWTANAMDDWDYVKAIVTAVQETCRFDSKESIEEIETDVVSDFLLVQQQGPDYLFAIATARLLRELGFRGRVVSGFYARAENFDRASGQTAVFPEDVHFWVEVQANDHSWLTVEPSPGYEVQYARILLIEKIKQGIHRLLAIIWLRKFAFLFGAMTLVTIVINRRRFYAYTLRFWWLLPLPRTDRAVVRTSISVLVAHAELYGCQRRPETTVEKWLQTVTEDNGESVSLAEEFRRLVQWALYSGLEPRPTSADPRQICREFLSRHCGFETRSENQHKKKHYE